MTYLWLKAFHIVGVVAWFAGVFYLPRLFVYHAEAREKPEPARSILQGQYQIMEKRLYRIIMTPAMVLALAMAAGLVALSPELLQEPWLHIKLALVALLVAYHVLCGWVMTQLAAGTCQISGQQFRWFNEVPTVLFVVVVMLAVFKNDLPTSWTAWVVVAMVVAMIATLQLYARKRRLDQQKALGS